MPGNEMYLDSVCECYSYQRVLQYVMNSHITWGSGFALSWDQICDLQVQKQLKGYLLAIRGIVHFYNFRENEVLNIKSLKYFYG